MANRLNWLLHGKNSKLCYYLRCFLRYVFPRRLLQARLDRVLARLDRRPDREYILDRVAYYNKLTTAFKTPPPTACGR